MMNDLRKKIEFYIYIYTHVKCVKKFVKLIDI